MSEVRRTTSIEPNPIGHPRDGLVAGLHRPGQSGDPTNGAAATPLPGPGLSGRSIFISYSSEDREWAAEVSRILSEGGDAVFFDCSSLRSGDDWPSKLKKALGEASCVRLLWSETAARSEWVGIEYTEALKKGPGGLRIELLDETPLPDALKHIQAEESVWFGRTAEFFLKPALRTKPEKPRPIQMLRSEFAYVDYYDPDARIDEVEAWCTNERLFAARLYTGPGGAGKTRFVIEACRRMAERHEWKTGFLKAEFNDVLKSDPLRAREILNGRSPRLIVVDYAETRRPELRALLTTGLTKTGGQPARVIMVARSTAAWWEHLLVDEAYEIQEAAGTLVTQRALQAPIVDEEQRARLFDNAVRGFIEGAGAVAPQQLPRLEDTGDAHRPLVLLLMALRSVVDPDAAASGDESGRDVIDWMIGHERRYWKRRVGEALFEELRRAVALITLRSGCPAGHSALHRVLANDPRYIELGAKEQRVLTGAAIALYGFGDRIESLQPDLLGERLVTTVLADDEELQSAWTGGCTDAELSAGLTVLTRAARANAANEALLTLALRSTLDQAAGLAVAIALETGDPIGRLLASELREAGTESLCRSLLDEMPDYATPLLELQVAAGSVVFETLKSRHDETSESERSELARIANNLSVDLGNLNRPNEALSIGEEAVTIRRELAAMRPEVFQPVLANSLNNLGVQYDAVGRRDEALAVSEEAVTIQRELASTRPEVFRPALASCLDNLGIRYDVVGRRDDALAVAEEAVAIRRELAAMRPEVFRPALATSLNNLGIRYNAVGRRDDALAVTEEAVAIRRELAAMRPEVFRPVLATSLNNFGAFYNVVGRRDDALSVTEEAVTIYRELAAMRPEVFRPALAMSLNNLGNRYDAVGRGDDAFSVTEEAVAIRRELAKVRPLVYETELSSSLHNLSLRLQAAGRPGDAFTAAEEALALLKPHYDKRPAAWENRFVTMKRQYLALCDALDVEPKTGLVG